MLLKFAINLPMAKIISHYYCAYGRMKCWQDITADYTCFHASLPDMLTIWPEVDYVQETNWTAQQKAIQLLITVIALLNICKLSQSLTYKMNRLPQPS